jgi:hypothetical protein
MSYEIDETTALLARHVAALDDIYAKIRYPGLGHQQGLGRSTSLEQGQGLVITKHVQELEQHMTNAPVAAGLTTFPSYGPEYNDHKDPNMASIRVNKNMNDTHIRTTTTTDVVHDMTSSGSRHNEQDNMALALKEQIQVSRDCFLSPPTLCLTD